jgi:hypothetical protein
MEPRELTPDELERIAGSSQTLGLGNAVTCGLQRALCLGRGERPEVCEDEYQSCLS